MSLQSKKRYTYPLFKLLILSVSFISACDENEEETVGVAGESLVAGTEQGGEIQAGVGGAGEVAGLSAGAEPAGLEGGAMTSGIVAGAVAEEPDLLRGDNLYQQFCGFCHGSSGEGYLADHANALSNPDFLSTVSDEFLSLATIHGRPGTPMSPWGQEKGGPLDASMVRDIVAFIRSWQIEASVVHPTPSLVGSAQRGRPLYNAVCASCHGENGEGVSAVSLNNPWFLETVSDAFIAHAIQVGRRGTAMSAYGPPLVNEQGVADLIALIRSWTLPVDMDPPPPFTPQVDQTPLNPEGDEPSFELREGRFVPAQQVYDALIDQRRLTLIDARPAADYLDEHIDGAISLPFYEIDNYITELDPQTFTITYCGCPHAVSGQAADALIAQGFERVAVLDEGFYEWRDTFGFPTTSGTQPSAQK